MIERLPGSWTGSGRIAAWYTLVSASSSATKASRLSSRSGIEQCTAASVCQVGRPSPRPLAELARVAGTRYYGYARLAERGRAATCRCASGCMQMRERLHVNAEVMLGRHGQHHDKQHDVDGAEDNPGQRYAPAARPAICPPLPDAAEDDRERSENDLEDEYPDDPADKRGDGQAVGSGLRPRRGLGAGVRHWCLAPLKLNWQQLSARHAPKRAYSLRFVSNSGILSLIPHIGHGRVCVQLLGSARADG